MAIDIQTERKLIIYGIVFIEPNLFRTLVKML